MGNVKYQSKVFLIELGKTLPFVVCSIVLISYIESLISLIANDCVVYDDALVLNKRVSWFIGNYFEYNLSTIVILLTISVAIETCYWNKLAILYLTIQLMEKDYFLTIELYKEVVYIIVVANIIVSAFFVYKGIKILLTKNN